MLAIAQPQSSEKSAARQDWRAKMQEQEIIHATARRGMDSYKRTEMEG